MTSTRKIKRRHYRAMWPSALPMESWMRVPRGETRRRMFKACLKRWITKP